jgi:hypothetical protein
VPAVHHARRLVPTDGELFVYGLMISERTVLNDYDLMKKDQFDDDFSDCEIAERDDEFIVDLTGEMQDYLLATCR